MQISHPVCHRFLLLSSLLLLIAFSAVQDIRGQSGAGYYAIQTSNTGNPDAMFQLMRINPESGEVLRLTTDTILGFRSALDGAVIDPVTQQYIFLGVRNRADGRSVDNYIFALDTKTGAVVHELNYGAEPHRAQTRHLAYNCLTNGLYALVNDVNLDEDDGIHLVRINIKTGDYESFPRASEQLTFFNRSSFLAAIDQKNNLFVYSGNFTTEFGSVQRVITIDLATGKMKKAIETPGILVREVLYNCRDSSIYAVGRSAVSTDILLIRLDPVSGEFDIIGNNEINGFDGRFIASGESIIDPIKNQIIIKTIENPSFGQAETWVTIDLETAKIISILELEEKQLNLLARGIPCGRPADFSVENTCIGSHTTFEANEMALEWIWDFGDPSTGERNTAYGRWPSHVFSDTGTFKVKLVTRSCYSTDSATQTVRIYPFHQNSFNTDTVLCPDDTFLLQAGFNDSLTYFWSDSSTGSSNYVKGPGTYWVQIQSPSCLIYDTVQLLGTPANLLEFGEPKQLCAGEKDTVDLSALGNTFLWTSGNNNPFRVFRDSGLYAVTVFDGICTNSDTLKITHAPPIPDLFADLDSAICPDHVLQPFLPQELNYRWADGSLSNQPTLRPGKPYLVTISNLQECVRYDTAFIAERTEPIVKLQRQNDSLFAIPPQAGALYEWWVNDEKLEINSQPFLPEFWAGNYRLQVTDAYGCIRHANTFLPEIPCNDIKVYPNPSKSELQVEVQRKAVLNMQLYNMQGQLVGSWDNLIQSKVQDWLPPGIDAGVYLLRIETNQCVAGRRIVVPE